MPIDPAKVIKLACPYPECHWMTQPAHADNLRLARSQYDRHVLVEHSLLPVEVKVYAQP